MKQYTHLKSGRLVQLINQKTKIKKDEISDILAILPDVIAELFFESNPEEKEHVFFPMFSIMWQKSYRNGSMTKTKKSQPLVQAILRQKKLQKTPLAIKLLAMPCLPTVARQAKKEQKSIL